MQEEWELVVEKFRRRHLVIKNNWFEPIVHFSWDLLFNLIFYMMFQKPK